jgi:hypothetical protein
MTRIPLRAGTTAVVAAALIPAAALAPVASAQPVSRGHARAYEHAYHEVAHKLGRQVPGRNIVEDGTLHGSRPSDSQTLASLAVLRRMLAPPASTSSSSSTGASDVSGGSAAGAPGVPSCASESGTNYSTGPDNTNPSSGATGRYQILPSTAAAYGCDLTTAAGQDACAQTIYEHQGASAWVGCGG